jgi:serine/threonine protein kinase
LATDRRGYVSKESARHQLYVGTDKRTNTSALIKVTSKPGLVYQDNLRNEIACLAAINESLPESNYFPVLKDHGELRDGRVFIVESFFTELPLATAIGPERIPGKTVSFLRTALEVARALGQLHGLKIYHVDLNPMNVLLRLQHGAPIVRLIDFESAYQWSRHAADGVFYNPPNTPGYSAPEIADRTPDGRSDVFSLGAVLYTMMAGFKWTWEGDVWTRAADGDLDPDLERIVIRAVAPEPADRYPSVKDFYESLAGYLEGIWPGRHDAPWP